MPERKYHRLRRPRSLLKSQKKHGPGKYKQQSKMAEPKNPPVEIEETPEYKPRFTLKNPEGSESTVDRILRRASATSMPNSPEAEEIEIESDPE